MQSSANETHCITGFCVPEWESACKGFEPNIHRPDQAKVHAVVVRKWHSRDDRPGGKVGFPTNEAVDKPLQVFDAYDDRSLIENCCIKENKQAWNLKHPPEKTERAVQVHVLFTLAMFALATAYRLRAERVAVGD